jgi:secretion/DNA translocation related TadE-like protein
VTCGAGERGSASIWVLAGAGLAGLVAAVAVLRGNAVLARHRAEGAADLSALAAAGHIGVDTGACAAAADIAAANGATVVSCTVSGGYDARSGTVLVRVRMPVRLPVVAATFVTASALAGRGVPP